jgi:cellobiose phosphorylase
MDADPSRRYGVFSDDRREFVVTDPRPPRPWSNIIANPRIGLAVSQSGSGFTWVDNSQLAVVTAWQQDFAQDTSGKFLYVRDAVTGEIWSLSPAPVWADYDSFACHHGIGFTTFHTVCRGIEADWTLFVDAEAAVEMWRVELTNRSGRRRTLELVSYLEWCCGVAPAPRREFHKLFLETRFDPAHGIVLGSNHMWDVGSKRWGHWNTDFPYVAAFGTDLPVVSAEGDKAAFLGRNGTLRDPAALALPAWRGRFGRHEDPVAALRSRVILEDGATRRLGFALGIGATAEAASARVASSLDPAAMDAALAEVRAGWAARLGAHRVDSPEPALNALVNDWVRYQAITARLWGRCGYYQQSGAYGFRDQLQDAQIWLTIEPERCREQIRLHAGHQFSDGTVYHWWHPLSEHGHVTAMTDDLLWLGFVAASYVRETGELSVLDDSAPFLDEPAETPLHDHVLRAFRRVFARTSERGIPLIGAGDWNDGLSAVGLQGKGESFWLGQFLAGLLADWSVLWRLRGDAALADEFTARRGALVTAINRHGWDGRWYRRGTLDDGTVLGGAGDSAGRIFLNAQTWAVLNDVAPADRAAACMAAVEEHLVSPAGALLLAPAFDAPREEIGYITRYAPGLRENGGVYTHAATWAIAAACKVRDAALAARLLAAIDPTGKDQETYQAEPYVLPGNVDGPLSPYHGRAGWTWYTGSAAWLHRVVSEWVFGVRPEWDGLRIDPSLPPAWDKASMVRPWRGHVWNIRITREPAQGRDRATEVRVDGALVPGGVIPPPQSGGGTHLVDVRLS